jgi:glucose 1-dehydrogenase
MTGILEGKVAVITGSTRGLGRAIAQAYISEGAAVVISGRSEASVTDALEQLDGRRELISGLAADVGDPAQIDALAAHAIRTFGQLDIWVNNAATSSAYGPTIHIPPDNFLRTIQTNIFGVYYGSLTAMRQFLAQGQGKLINIIGRGARKPGPYQNAYASSKAWVRNFTLALAAEYRDSGVGVFVFNPGLMDTALLRKPQAIEGYETRLNALKTVIRLWAEEPSVAAQKALWLASTATDGSTGREVRTMNAATLLAGIFKDGWRRLTRQSMPAIELEISTVPATFPPNKPRHALSRESERLQEQESSHT